MPASSLNVVSGDPLLRGSIRVWDLKRRSIVRTITVPSAIGTMDVKLIPRDPQGRAFASGMFDGFVYLVDTRNGTAKAVFDCESIVPHIDVPVRGGMTQLMAMPRSGDRLIFGLFQDVRVMNVSRHRLALDRRFDVDFNHRTGTAARRGDEMTKLDRRSRRRSARRSLDG